MFIILGLSNLEMIYAVMSNLRPMGHMCPRIGLNVVQHICRWHHIIISKGWTSSLREYRTMMCHVHYSLHLNGYVPFIPGDHIVIAFLIFPFQVEAMFCFSFCPPPLLFHFKRFIDFNFVYEWVICVYRSSSRACSLHRGQKSVTSLGTRITGSCEPQKQVLLAAKSSPMPHAPLFWQVVAM